MHEWNLWWCQSFTEILFVKQHDDANMILYLHQYNRLQSSQDPDETVPIITGCLCNKNQNLTTWLICFHPDINIVSINPLYLMDFPIHNDMIIMGLPIVYFKGS